MDINDKLFENIIIVGNPQGDTDIFDEVEAQEEKMRENQDLYTAFDKITKVWGQLIQNKEVQSIAPAIDVNKGIISIPGVTMNSVASEESVLTPEETVTRYVESLAKVIPDNLKVDYEIIDPNNDSLPKMDKMQFHILVSRKG